LIQGQSTEGAFSMSDSEAGAGELAIKPAWKLDDPALRRDALSFWEQLNILPASASLDARLNELCAVAYAGDSVAGVATALVRRVDFLGCDMAMFRCAVSPGARLMRCATKLTLQSIEILEAWSLANPSAGVMGMGSVIQSRALVEHDRHAVWPDTKLTFVGYTQQGQQFRLVWFKHAMVHDAVAPPGDMPQGIKV
jgi:hypothetical protein